MEDKVRDFLEVEGWDFGDGHHDQIVKCIEKFTKQEVLKALEEEVPKAANKMQEKCVTISNNCLKNLGYGVSVFEVNALAGIEYYKNEVKPKYEKND